MKPEQTHVLLVYCNPIIYPFALSYGLDIIETALLKNNINTKTIRPFYSSEPYQELVKAINDYNPVIVAFSFRNLDSAGFHYEDKDNGNFLHIIKRFVEAAARKQKITVIGGGGFSIYPGGILKETGADIGFVGPSETEFTKFCLRIIFWDHTLKNASKGLKTAFLKGTPPPIPQRRPLLSSNRITRQQIEFAKMVGGTIPIRTKTGCSLRCGYCVVPSIEQLYLRSWQDIVNDFKLVLENDLQERVFIADSEFNIPSISHSMKLCKKIRQEFGNTIKWRCYMEAGNISNDLLNAMRSSGCAGISLSIDTFDNNCRKIMGKGTSAKEAIRAVRLCMESGIPTGINLLFGCPGETLMSAKDSAYIARDFNFYGIELMLTIGIRIYPNTPFEKLTRSKAYGRFCAKSSEGCDWLATFCSPCPPVQLAAQILKILPPGKTIKYTESLSYEDNSFYRKLANGNKFLCNRQFKQAKTIFSELKRQYPNRKEPKLGLLKIQIGELNPSSKKTK